MLLRAVPDMAGDAIPQANGIVRTEYDAGPLRGNLGMPIRENRYAKARRERELAASRVCGD